jgi:hypothetical protein
MGAQSAATLEEVVATARAWPVAAPALLDRSSWRDAALAWLCQRALLLGVTLLGWAFPLAPSAGHRSPWDVLLPWATLFDGARYAVIARSGYADPQYAAFFPLYPLLERLLSILTGGDVAAVALLLANVCCFGAFGLLRVLAERELGRAAARRALLYQAIFPTSLFLAAAYSEALFLLLSLGAFLALRRGRWLAAGLLIALATLTRPVGVLLVAALTVECALRHWTARRVPDRRTLACMAVAIALPCVALAGLSLYLAARFGTPLAMARAQAMGWGRRLSWPWVGATDALQAVLHDNAVHQFYAGLDLLATLGAVALLPALFRRLPLSYGSYAAATLLLVLLTPIRVADWAALHSNTRFLLVVFPLFLLLGRWGGRRWIQRVILVASLSLLILLTLAFANGAWIA